MQELRIMRAVALKVFDGPRQLAKSGKDDVIVGRLYGLATKEFKSKGPDGITEFVGFMGSFRAVPADAESPITASGKLFLPEAFHVMIADTLNSTGEVVEFAFEVEICKDTNKAGYTWALIPLLAPSASDPLTALMGRVNTARLEAPVEPEPAPAPAPAAGGRGRK